MVAGLMEAEDVTAAAVGRRVSCDGERATVRYVGPVPPTAGELRAEVKGHLQAFVQPSGLRPQVCGWDWSGTSPAEGSTTAAMTESSTSAAGETGDGPEPPGLNPRV